MIVLFYHITYTLDFEEWSKNLQIKIIELVIFLPTRFGEALFRIKIISVLGVSLAIISVTMILYFVFERPLKVFCDVYARKSNNNFRLLT